MTTEDAIEAKEMIAVLEAYIKGEEIEFSRVNADNWVYTRLPSWNWEDYKYRIKPKEEEIKYKKEEIEYEFKKGDIIVHKELCDGTPLNKDNNFLIIEDVNLSENKYQVYNKGLGAFEFFDTDTIDENYVNIDDCLLYWEYYDDNYEAFTKTDRRYDKEDCIDYLRQTTSHLTPMPIYQLGARLPKDKK